MEAIIIGAQRRSKYSHLAPLGKPLTEAVRSPPTAKATAPSPLRPCLPLAPVTSPRGLIGQTG